MSDFLNGIRHTEKKIPAVRQVVYTVCILLFGVGLGVFSKFLDCTASNELPVLIAYLDIRNFLGRFSIWILLAVCISVYSMSPVRAGINVLAFFAGMVTSYYLYSNFIAGFFPKSYAMIWIVFTLISPFPAALCWYAKGEGGVAVFLSAGIFACLFDLTFSYGWLYFDIRSPLELLVFVCGFAVLRRGTVRETLLMAGMGVALAWLLRIVLPFRFG